MMGDSLPVVWPAEPHTSAKHAILRGYLDAWLPILSRQEGKTPKGTREILFIDGFAGPGEYEKGEPGSPAIALSAALNHSVPFPTPVRFLFIEQNAERFTHLCLVLDRYSEALAKAKGVRLTRPRQGDCETILSDILDEYQEGGRRFGPALVFLDQFGYSDVSMALITRILSHSHCEVFSYLDYKGMNRWISDEAKWPAFTRAYGGDEWREALSMQESRRRSFLREQYENALRTRAKAKYVCSFSMFDRSNFPLYWLVFCTNNLRGLEVMKTAMWKVDATGGFRFSDEDNPAQLRLLQQEFDQDWLADQLVQEFADRTLTVDDVREHVLTRTPCRLFKDALAILETRRDPPLKVLSCSKPRRRGRFPDPKMVIQFPPRTLF